MSTEAFGSRRVTESLKAIAKYLDDGAQLAGGVAPAQGLRLDLDLVEREPGPRLRLVSPGVIEFTPGQPYSFDLSVVGSDLDTVQAFKLVRGKDEITSLPPIALTPTSFTARFIGNLPPVQGDYDAFVENERGQTHVLDDACRLEVRNSEGPYARTPSLQLGALVPSNIDHDNTTVGAFLVGLSGTPSEVYITKLNNERLDWHVDVGPAPSEWKPDPATWQQYFAYNDKAITLRLNIKVPYLGTVPAVFYLVAKPVAPNSEVKHVFSVLKASTRLVAGI